MAAELESRLTDAGQWLDNEAFGAPLKLVKDWSWPDGKADVFEVRDRAGTTWFVKQHRHDEFYESEKTAYARWVPALDDRAPDLRESNDDLRILVLSALPRDTETTWHDDDVRRDAGAVLRHLHDTEDLGVCEDLAAEKETELEQWLTRGPGLLESREVDFARSALRAMPASVRPERVPCHRDYTPRNWVLGNGRVHVVDFEEMRPDAWMVDLGRLTVAWWPADPPMLEPLLDGYGRQLSDDETAILRCTYVVTAVRLIVLGSELGKTEFVASTRDVLRRLGDLIS